MLWQIFQTGLRIRKMKKISNWKQTRFLMKQTMMSKQGISSLKQKKSQNSHTLMSYQEQVHSTSTVLILYQMLVICWLPFVGYHDLKSYKVKKKKIFWSSNNQLLVHKGYVTSFLEEDLPYYFLQLRTLLIYFLTKICYL